MNKKHGIHQLQEGINAYQSKKLEKAEAIFCAILETNPNDPQALHFLGCIFKEKGDLIQAVKLIQKSIELDKTQFLPFLNLGKILMSERQHENAVFLFKQALIRNQRSADAWFSMGNALYALGREEEVIQCFKNTLNFNSKHAGAASNLGACLMEKEKFQEAKSFLELAIELDPKHLLARINYGKCLSDLGHDLNAKDHYEIALDLSNESPELFYNYANTLKRLGDFHRAIDLYKKAIAIKPDFADAWFNLAAIFTASKDFNQAIESYQKAIEFKPDFIEAISELAEIYKRQKRYLESIQLYQNVLRLDHNHTNAISGLGWSFLESGRINEAVTYYQKSLKSNKFNRDSYFFLFESLKERLTQKLNKSFSYPSELIEICLDLMCKESIVAFGDSHILIFEELNSIVVHHIGAPTAYNLINEHSSTKGRNKILTRLQNLDPKKDAILLSFGEVDCRANVIKYCHLEDESIKHGVNKVSNQYIQFINEIQRKGFMVLVYGGYGAGSDRLAYGSQSERTKAAYLLDKTMKEEARNHHFYYFSLHNLLIQESQMLTRDNFLCDDFHLFSDQSCRLQIQTLLFDRLLLELTQFDMKKIDQYQIDSVEENICIANIFSTSNPFLYYSSSKRVSNIDICSLTFDLGAIRPLKGMDLETDSKVCDKNELQFTLDGKKLSFDLTEKSMIIGFHVNFLEPYPLGRYLTIISIKPSNLCLKGWNFYFKRIH